MLGMYRLFGTAQYLSVSCVSTLVTAWYVPYQELIDTPYGMRLRTLYVLEELNIKSVVPCNDPLRYASLRAEPDFRYAVDWLPNLLACDVLVILDLRADESLFDAGVALCITSLSQVVNRIQKLRKKAGLEPTDIVELYYESLEKDEKILEKIVNSQANSVIIGLKSHSLLAIPLLAGYFLSRGVSDKLRVLCKFLNPLTILQIKVDCIENQPSVDLELGKHLFLSVADFYMSRKTS
ncbi:hypothetical protein BHE74_00036212 [Ensete ventricosum]|nr:hypothetical protein BHE74_00036212 [Ensete ventricosum]